MTDLILKIKAYRDNIPEAILDEYFPNIDEIRSKDTASSFRLFAMFSISVSTFSRHLSMV